MAHGQWRAVLGIETEYGISATRAQPGPAPDPITLSEAVVRAAASDGGWHTEWNYGDETPLVDARGTVLDRRVASPDLLTDVVEYANVLLGNGARVYVDHAHPEHSGPEVTSAHQAVVYDRAGDTLMQRAAERAGRASGLTVRLHKNNSDGKGHSYGCHENYLVPRSVPFDDIVAGFTGHLVSRLVLTGAGRVGLGARDSRPGFQLGQRPDYFEARVGLETTVNRPLINTRDEPHADRRRYRRLHVITGDANLSETATFVKVGASAIVLAAIADGAQLPRLADPVQAFRDFSHDPSLAATAETTTGERISALEVQRRCLDAASAVDWQVIDDQDEVLGEWALLLDDLDADPSRCADRLDWVSKYELLAAMRRRDGLDWSHPKLAAIDLQYADLDPARGLFFALERSGRLARRSTDADVARAMAQPPSGTRAWLRGRLLARFPESVVAANWDSVTLELPRGHIVNLRLTDPLAHTAAQDQRLLERAESAEQFVVLLGERTRLGSRV